MIPLVYSLQCLRVYVRVMSFIYHCILLNSFENSLFIPFIVASQVFIKWFGSRMSKFQKADGIDVAKVSEDFVKHKIFDTEADALAFLDKVDADGNGALSYEEFCEGVENMNDYLTVMLLKKFIHSLKSRPQDYHSRNTKEQDKYGKLISERMMKKGDVEPAHTTTKKASIPSASNTSVGDIATAATVVKTNLPGGGVMFTHISARKRADPVASLTVPTHAVSNSNNNDGGPSTHKKSEKKHGHFPLMRSNTMMSTMGGKTNSIKKNSLFLDPSSDAMIRESELMMSQGGLMDLNLESEAVLEEPSMLSSVSAKYGKNKTSEEDIAAINRTMNKKLANFMTYRQMSFEEKENLKSSESNDFLASTVNDESLVLEDMSSSPSSPTYRSRGATVAWGDEGSIGSPGSPESPKARGFKNKLVGAIARSAMKMNS